jgi:hypothetical protein
MSHRRDDALRVLRDWLKAEGSGSAGADQAVPQE